VIVVRLATSGAVHARAAGKDGKVEYQIPKVGRRGSAWVSEASLPEVVVRAYELLAKERAQLSGSRCYVNG
jgi:hypothetical protein